MPISIPAFTTTASITGNTLIANTDNQLNQFMADAKTYVETTYNTVATSLEGNVGIHVTTAKGYSDAALFSSNVATQSKDVAVSSATNANTSSLSAAASAQLATEQADLASQRLNTIQTIKVQGQTLAPGQSVSVNYNPTDKRISYW